MVVLAPLTITVLSAIVVVMVAARELAASMVCKCMLHAVRGYDGFMLEVFPSEVCVHEPTDFVHLLASFLDFN